MDLDASQPDSGQGPAPVDPGLGAASAAGAGCGYGPGGPGYLLWSYPDLTSNRMLYPPQAGPDGSSPQPEDGGASARIWDQLSPSVRALVLDPGTPVDASGAAAQASLVSPATGNQNIDYSPVPVPKPLVTPGADVQAQDDDYSQFSFRVRSPAGVKNYAPETFYPGAQVIAGSHPGDTYAGVTLGPNDISDAKRYVEWFQATPPNPHAGEDWTPYGFKRRDTGLDAEQQASLADIHRFEDEHWPMAAAALAPLAVAAAPGAATAFDTAGAWLASQAPWTVPASVTLSAAATGAPLVPAGAAALRAAGGLEDELPDLEGLHPVQVGRIRGLKHQAASAVQMAEKYGDPAEEVAVRPHTADGPADYFVRVDGIGKDKSTGDLHLWDAKLGDVPSYTPRQLTGYDLLRRYGGTIIGKMGGELYPKGTYVPPTEIHIIQPSDLFPQTNRLLSPASPPWLSALPHLLEQTGNVGYQSQPEGDVGRGGRQQ